MWLFSHVSDQRKSPLWLSLIWLNGRNGQIEDEGGVFLHYVFIALSCDHFLLHVSLLISIREKLVAFLVHAFPWRCSLGARVSRWPTVVWKMQIGQTDGSGGKSIGEVYNCRVQVQKPSQQWFLLPFISSFLCLPPLLWSLWRFWGACSDGQVLADNLNLLCRGLAFVLMLVSGVYLLVMHQEKVDSFCYWLLLIDQEGSSLRSVNSGREWCDFNVFVLLCHRIASAVDGWTSVQKKQKSLLTEILWWR